MFVRFLQIKEMVADSSDAASVAEYRKWLCNCYGQTKDSLLAILKNSTSKASQLLALSHLLKLLATEGKYPIDVADTPSKPYFPQQSLRQVCSALLSEQRDMTAIISKYQEVIEYDDAKFFTLKVLSQLLKQHKDEPQREDEANGVYVTNAHALLALIELPILGKKPKRRKGEKAAPPSDSDCLAEGRLLCEPINCEWPKFELSYEAAAEHFAAAWLHLLSHQVCCIVFPVALA